MSSFSKSDLLDVRLMQSGFNAMLVLSIAIGTHIELFKLKANKRHILSLLSLVDGLQASYNEREYLFVYVIFLLYAYKSNSLIGSYKESISCSF
jgi:hypothetical protein